MIIPCLWEHLGAQLCQEDLVTIVDDIPVTPVDENFAYWSASFKRAGKWFSSSLALGTDDVANIVDKLFSDKPCIVIVQDVTSLPILDPP